jgi:hypothetical protein
MIVLNMQIRKSGKLVSTSVKVESAADNLSVSNCDV